MAASYESVIKIKLGLWIHVVHLPGSLFSTRLGLLAVQGKIYSCQISNRGQALLLLVKLPI